jgi:hypothetical protein
MSGCWMLCWTIVIGCMTRFLCNEKPFAAQI